MIFIDVSDIREYTVECEDYGRLGLIANLMITVEKKERREDR